MDVAEQPAAAELLRGMGFEDDAIAVALAHPHIRSIGEAVDWILRGFPVFDAGDGAAESSEPAAVQAVQAEQQQQPQLSEGDAANRSQNEQQTEPVHQPASFQLGAEVSSLENFVFHRAVFFQDGHAIRELSKEPVAAHLINARDERGNTPLVLSLLLGDWQIAHELLSCGADPALRNLRGFSPLQLACSSQSRELVTDMLLCTIQHRRAIWEERIPRLIGALSDVVDFDMSMNFEIASWVPLVSSFAPKDTFKISKYGSSLKFECTLIGFEGVRARRGHIAFLFRNTEDGAVAHIIDYEGSVYQDAFEFLRAPDHLELMERVNSLLENESAQAELNTENAECVPSIGWNGRPKRDKVGRFNCTRHQVKGVDFVVIKRKERSDSLALGDVEEYFSARGSNDGRTKADQKGGDLMADVEGLTSEVRKRVQINLSLADSFPLPLETMQDLLTVLSETNVHLSQLAQIFRLKFPGFPVKIEIPVEVGITAVITFAKFQERTTGSDGMELPPDFRQVERLFGF